MAQRWSRFSFHRFGGQFCSDLFRQKRSQHQSYLRQRTEDRRTRHYLAQSFAQYSLRQWAFHFLLDNITPDIQQIVIAHTRRTGGFTITASEAAIEMLLCFKRDFVAFQHLFNQIDAPARPVQFIAQKLIGWAGCGTKSAVNTGAQVAVGLQRARVLPHLFS